MTLHWKGPLVLMVVATILVPGLATNALASAGYKTLAGIVWAGGYGFGIVAIWYLWIRPLEITGPTGTQLTGDEDTDQDSDPPEESTP